MLQYFYEDFDQNLFCTFERIVTVAKYILIQSTIRAEMSRSLEKSKANAKGPNDMSGKMGTVTGGPLTCQIYHE